MVQFLEVCTMRDFGLGLNKKTLIKTSLRGKHDRSNLIIIVTHIKKIATSFVLAKTKKIKTMKKIIIVLAVLVSTITFAQNKNAKASLEVNGVCLMCKARIEKTSLNTKGVKSAIWDVKTHDLKLIFDDSKTDLKTIEKNIVAAGHDTKNLKADDKAYKNISACCQYRDAAVIHAH
jgi:periplasmic mercuric ion binding protein